MRFKLILPILIIFVVSFFLIKLSSETIEKKEEERRKVKITQAIVKPLYLNLEDTSRSITLKDIGVSYLFDEDELQIDKEKLETYFNDLEKEYEFMSKNTIVSFEDYSFRTPSEKARIKFDTSPFSDKDTVSQLISSGDFKVRVQLDTEDDPVLQKQKTEAMADRMSQPMLIKYGRNPVTINTETIRSFISIEERNGIYYGTLKEESVSDYLDTLHEKFANPNVKVIHNYAVDSIRRALLYRATDYQVNSAVILPLEGKPMTKGELHEVYLEVIKSQQRLYRFEKGKLTKTYIISTGLTWETPPGEFRIQGKDRMAISYFGNWYMPHYLPIGLIHGQYRFGFHAIPYHMDGAGNIYSRNPNTMGSPATGGCIQMTSEDAEELFTWSWVGIPVYVYE